MAAVLLRTKAHFTPTLDLQVNDLVSNQDIPAGPDVGGI